MAQSKKKTRQQLSVICVSVSILALGASVTVFGHRDFRTGFACLGLATLSAVVLLGFTLPTRCRVITTRHEPCRNEAYGLVFGCSGAPGHKSAKFFARLGWRPDALRTNVPGGHESSAYKYAAAAPSQSSEAQSIMVIVSSSMGVCGFWFGFISTVAAVAAVVVGIMGLR